MKELSEVHERSRARALLHFLKKHKKKLSPLLILTHDFPDPDAIASAFGLKYLMGTFGISARIAYGGMIGRLDNRAMVEVLKIRMYKLRPADLKKYSNVALVDTQPAFGNNPFPSQRKATLVIDQHISIKKPIADFVTVDTTSGATCVLIAQALLATKKRIPQAIATAIAYGIITDTLDLYRAKKKSVIDTYLKILSWSNMRDLARIQYPVQERRFFITLKKGMQVARAGRGLVISHLGHVKSPELVSQVADFLLGCKGFRWCFVTGRHGKKLYLSLRNTKSKLDAGAVLRDVVDDPRDAGGHGSIAGGSVRVIGRGTDKGWQRIEHMLTSALKKRLRMPARKRFQSAF